MTLRLQQATDFTNAGLLDVANDFTLTVTMIFANSRYIDVANNFTLTTNNFSNENTGRIGLSMTLMLQ